MGRFKVPDDNKAKAITMSLGPKHTKMITFLIKKLQICRSTLMKQLLENEYKNQGGK